MSTIVMKFWRGQQQTEVHGEKARESVKNPAVRHTTEEEEEMTTVRHCQWVSSFLTLYQHNKRPLRAIEELKKNVSPQSGVFTVN